MPYICVDENGCIKRGSVAEIEKVKLLDEIERLKTAIKRLREDRDLWSNRALEKQAILHDLEKAGIKIPEDIAIVGFNNNPISRVIDPNLSTIHYPGQEMGEIAATTLINRLDNKQPENLLTIVLNHKLIIRESSNRNNQ